MATPRASATFQAVVDTGGPLTVIASDILDGGGDPVDSGTTMLLRLGGSTNGVPLYELGSKCACRTESQPIGRSPGDVCRPYSILGQFRARRSCSVKPASSMRSR